MAHPSTVAFLETLKDPATLRRWAETFRPIGVPGVVPGSVVEQEPQKKAPAEGQLGRGVIASDPFVAGRGGFDVRQYTERRREYRSH